MIYVFLAVSFESDNWFVINLYLFGGLVIYTIAGVAQMKYPSVSSLIGPVFMFINVIMLVYLSVMSRRSPDTTSEQDSASVP